MTKTSNECPSCTIEKLGDLGWVYRLGPFTSKFYATKGAAKAQATRHERRGGVSAEWYRRAAITASR